MTITPPCFLFNGDSAEFTPTLNRIFGKSGRSLLRNGSNVKMGAGFPVLRR